MRPLGWKEDACLVELYDSHGEEYSDDDDGVNLEDSLFKKTFPSFPNCKHCKSEECHVDKYYDALCRHIHFTITNDRPGFQWMNKKRLYVYRGYWQTATGKPGYNESGKLKTPPLCVIWFIRVQLPNPPGQQWVHKKYESMPKEFQDRGWKKLVFETSTHSTVYSLGPGGAHIPKSLKKADPDSSESDGEGFDTPPNVVFCPKENQEHNKKSTGSDSDSSDSFVFRKLKKCRAEK